MKTQISSLRSFFKQPEKIELLGAASMLALFILPLLLYAYVGLFTRYVADDYETAGSLQKYGFWGSQVFWYQSWSGRYAYFALVNLFELLGVKAAPALTFVCLALWLAGLAWVIHQLLNRQNTRRPLYLSLLAACLILLTTLRSLAHIHQILFWVTGILTYVHYLIYFTFGLGWTLHVLRQAESRPAGWGGRLAFSLLAFIAAGLSEMGMTLQITALGLALAGYAFWPGVSAQRRRQALLWLGPALAVTLVGLVILFTAPGNAVRSSMLPPRPGLLDVAVQSNIYSIYFIANWIRQDTVLAGLSFLLPLLAALIWGRQNPPEAAQTLQRQALLWLPASAVVLYLLVLSQFATGYYALSYEPPARALVVPQYFLTATLVLWGYLSGRLLKDLLAPETVFPNALKLVAGVTLAILLALGPLYASGYIYTMIAPARERAIEWDERDSIIRQQIAEGKQDVIVWYIRDLNRLGDYSSDPEFLVNRAAADYYGLRSIIALDER